MDKLEQVILSHENLLTTKNLLERYLNLSDFIDFSIHESTHTSPIVQTVYGFYAYAASFEQTYKLTSDQVQVYRMVCGFISVMLMTDYMFLGPTDAILLLANLNFWGLFMTFLTMLLQFKSAHYETVKANTVADDIE